MRIKADTSRAPLAARAILALNGEDASEAIEEYLEQAIGTLEAVSSELAGDGSNKAAVDQLGLFLRVMKVVIGPRGGTRASLVLRRRPGRPRLSLSDVQRRLLAVDLVNQLVDKGEKRSWAVDHASKRYGISRTEVFTWLKRDRDGDLSWGRIFFPE